jgi:Ca2+/H+ antiporter, TMEM165/GDT1 family
MGRRSDGGMMSSWLGMAPTVVGAFTASLVECVEALTVVLAVGIVRGWRSALLGAFAALISLLVLVAVLGQSLARVQLALLQLLVGTLLLLFGLRWLRKAILRAAGLLALHDELATFAKETAVIKNVGTPISAWDRAGAATAFKIVMLEGIEVVFIVIALGAGEGRLLPAVLGATAALVVVIALGIALHRPLGRIPENTLKFAVGVLLAAFGTFWVSEGLHLRWPYADWSLLGLAAAYLVVAQILVLLCRSRATPARRPKKSEPLKLGLVNRILKEIVGLFVDDGALAAGIVVWVAVVGFLVGSLPVPMTALDVVFFFGLVALVTFSVFRGRHNSMYHEIS